MGNWFVGLNTAGFVNAFGSSGISLESGIVGSYSFIEGTRAVAPTAPAQTVVLSPSVEIIAESRLKGADSGATTATTVRVLPGLSFWWPRRSVACPNGTIGFPGPVQRD